MASTFSRASNSNAWASTTSSRGTVSLPLIALAIVSLPEFATSAETLPGSRPCPAPTSPRGLGALPSVLPVTPPPTEFPLPELNCRRAVSPQADPEELRPHSVVEGEPRRVVGHAEPGTNLAPLIPQDEFRRLLGRTRHEGRHPDFERLQAVTERVQPGGQGAQLWCLGCQATSSSRAVWRVRGTAQAPAGQLAEFRIASAARSALCCSGVRPTKARPLW